MSDQHYPVTFPADGPVDVSVRQGSGELTVTATDTTDVTVDLHASGRDADDLIDRTKVEFRNGSLRIETPKNSGMPRFDRSSVDVAVTVPSGSTADLHSGSGDIELEGEFGAVAGKTGSGGIAVSSCADARLRAGSGDIKVHRCASLNARTGSGDVHVEHAEGRVDLDTGSGDVEVSGSVTGGRVSAASGDIAVAAVDGAIELKTASGEITVGRAVEGEVRATAASGDISVGIVSGTAAHLDVSSVSGHVRSELDETDAPAESDRTLFLAVRTVSGSIRLHRTH